MLTREDLERREEAVLAPYAARSGRSLGRAHAEDEHPFRTAFQRDRDRVIHSTAFRRLQYKTQVFVNHEGDYYRTRLTHSTEAAQISRTIARALGLNEDLCEVVALGHDLGHTPFGHSGQDALDECMRPHGGFEHNRQSLRVVEVLERRYPGFPGLNLTFETRESIRKHGWPPKGDVEPAYRPDWSALLEAQLVDIADSIAYDAHDLDDGTKAGLLDPEGLSGLEVWRRATEGLPLKGEMLVRAGTRRLIDMEVRDLLETTEGTLRRLRIDSVEAVRAAREPLVRFSPEMERLKRELQKFLQAHLYRHHRVTMMAEKAKRFIAELFRCYTDNPLTLPPHFQEWGREVGVPRAVADYLAGMTDRYCQDEYRRLFHPFENLL
ncbi:MAG TPA: deoxyguanosinetriphosphate triphosphohydrolase [Planctomycetota bacterium]|nr:deoxyguanosinetriphosphate triphosphohydrolase [Planctomycetota bacterium]